MGTYVYAVTNGLAHDLRFIPAGYVPQPGEIVGNGDTLPSIASLSTAPPLLPFPGILDLIAVLGPTVVSALQAKGFRTS